MAKLSGVIVLLDVVVTSRVVNRSTVRLGGLIAESLRGPDSIKPPLILPPKTLVT